MSLEGWSGLSFRREPAPPGGARSDGISLVSGPCCYLKGSIHRDPRAFEREPHASDPPPPGGVEGVGGGQWPWEGWPVCCEPLGIVVHSSLRWSVKRTYVQR
jgi:hypothetical protein